MSKVSDLPEKISPREILRHNQYHHNPQNFGREPANDSTPGVGVEAGGRIVPAPSSDPEQARRGSQNEEKMA